MKRLSLSPTLLAVIAATLLLCGSIPAWAQKGGGKPGPTPVYPYKFTDLGPVAFKNSATKAYGITEPDEEGVVLAVGGGHSSPSPDYATAWAATPAGVLSAGILPDSRRGPAAVNDAGLIVYQGYSEEQAAFVGMADVPGVGTVELPSWFEPTAVNNLNQVVGSAFGGGDGMLITVNNDGSYSIEESRALWGFVPYAINDFGVVAGQHGNNAAIAWIEDGVLQIEDLPLPTGAYISRGAGINNLGEVVGIWANTKPFLWRPWEGIIWLTPDATNPGAALDINDQGQVVGWTYGSSTTRSAFLWEDGRLFDLTALSGVGTKSFRLGSADAINNAGQIIGHTATYKGPYVAAYGTYLLTPNP